VLSFAACGAALAELSHATELNKNAPYSPPRIGDPFSHPESHV
jgi:hypothetical protein